MKLRIEDLSTEELDQWVAKALGAKREGRYYEFTNGDSVLVTDWHPHSNVKQGNELIDKLKINLVYSHNSETSGIWLANEVLLSGRAKGETHLLAAARAVVLSAFPGEFI